MWTHVCFLEQGGVIASDMVIKLSKGGFSDYTVNWRKETGKQLHQMNNM